MRTSILRRLVGGAAAAALSLGLVGVVSVAPAHADETCSVRVTVQNKSGAPNLAYGAYASIWGYSYSSCPDGSPSVPLAGATYLQRSVDGRTWVNVKTSGSSYAAYYGSGLVTRTSWFRTVYYGGTYGTSPNATTFAGPVYSAAIRVGIFRKVAWSDHSVRGGLLVVGAIKPAYSIKGLMVRFQVKRGGRWVGYKRVVANRRGIVRAVFATTRYPGTAYRMLLPQKRGFIGSQHSFRAYHY